MLTTYKIEFLDHNMKREVIYYNGYSSEEAVKFFEEEYEGELMQIEIV